MVDDQALSVSEHPNLDAFTTQTLRNSPANNRNRSKTVTLFPSKLKEVTSVPGQFRSDRGLCGPARARRGHLSPKPQSLKTVSNSTCSGIRTRMVHRTQTWLRTPAATQIPMALHSRTAIPNRTGRHCRTAILTALHSRPIHQGPMQQQAQIRPGLTVRQPD